MSNSVNGTEHPLPAQPEPSTVLAAARARTPARILVGRAGPAYRTATQLELRHDHAAAVDAVHAELELPPDFVERWRLFTVQTRAASKSEYLLRPDLGRRLNDVARDQVMRECP